MAQCRGEGDAIHSFVNAASLRWDAASFAGAEHWLLHELKEPCRRGVKALENLPLVKPQRRYEIFLGDTPAQGMYSA
jgi:hypothetical protein